MRSNTPILFEDLKQYIPSAFAGQRRTATTSERYQYISTQHVIKGMIDAGYGVTRAQQKKTHKSEDMAYARHLIAFRPLEGFSTPTVGDAVPEVVMVNSHDGRSSYRLHAGIYRLICANGMIAGNDFANISVVHRGNVVEEVIKASEEIWGLMGKLNEWYLKAASTNLTKNKQFAYARDAAKIRHGDNVPYDSAQLLKPRREADEGSDAWHVYNRVQENLLKGGIEATTATGRRSVVRPINRVTKDVIYNQKLWDLTTEYLEAA